MTTEELNDQLAHACQSCQAACCKKGQLFLPRVEYERMHAHAQKLGSAAVEEFEERVSDHGSFLLYDQKDRCQFLDERNLCELHPLGLKPSECFWWPYHVFTAGSQESLEIRLYTSCCEGYRAHGPHSPYPAHIEEGVNAMGFDVVRAFRRQYGGSYDTQFIQSVAAEPRVSVFSPMP